MTVALDFDSLVGYLEEIVAEKGADYIYTTDPETVQAREAGGFSPNQCLYTGVNGKPGCIIGHLIHKLNPEFDLLSSEKTGASNAMRNAGLSLDTNPLTVRLVTEVQILQDKGCSWGDALEQGKDFALRLYRIHG